MKTKEVEVRVRVAQICVCTQPAKKNRECDSSKRMELTNVYPRERRGWEGGREGETGGRREIEMQGREERVRAGGGRKIRECAREK